MIDYILCKILYFQGQIFKNLKNFEIKNCIKYILSVSRIMLSESNL